MGCQCMGTWAVSPRATPQKSLVIARNAMYLLVQTPEKTRVIAMRRMFGRVEPGLQERFWIDCCSSLKFVRSLKTYESRLWQRNTRWQCDVIRMTFEVAQPFSPTWACHSSDILLLQRLWRVYILEPNDIQDKHNTYTANRHTQCPGIQSYLALSSKSIKITLFVWFKIHQSSAAAECLKLKF